MWFNSPFGDSFPKGRGNDVGLKIGPKDFFCWTNCVQLLICQGLLFYKSKGSHDKSMIDHEKIIVFGYLYVEKIDAECISH